MLILTSILEINLIWSITCLQKDIGHRGLICWNFKSYIVRLSCTHLSFQHSGAWGKKILNSRDILIFLVRLTQSSQGYLGVLFLMWTETFCMSYGICVHLETSVLLWVVWVVSYLSVFPQGRSYVAQACLNMKLLLSTASWALGQHTPHHTLPLYSFCAAFSFSADNGNQSSFCFPPKDSRQEVYEFSWSYQKTNIWFNVDYCFSFQFCWFLPCFFYVLLHFNLFLVSLSNSWSQRHLFIPHISKQSHQFRSEYCFSCITRYTVNTQKSIVFLYISMKKYKPKPCTVTPRK